MKSSPVSVVAVSFAILGCASETPPARAPEAPQSAAPVADTEAQKSPARSVVRVSEEIRRACGISDVDAHFAYDSSRVRSQDYPVFDKIVKCFVSGPLAKRQMRLVGHTDPRGEVEYNLVLGGRRADGVKAALVERGLTASQALTTSRGEMDASGKNESGWAQDRRVDIVLAN